MPHPTENETQQKKELKIYYSIHVPTVNYLQQYIRKKYKLKIIKRATRKRRPQNKSTTYTF